MRSTRSTSPWQYAVLLLVLGFSFLTTTAAFSIRQKPIRVMVVGDSMTHQKEGDFTWRYRLWEWFQRERIAVQFVGPYRGTEVDHKTINHEAAAAAQQLQHEQQQQQQQQQSPHNRRAYWDPELNWDGGYAPFVEAEFLNNGTYHFAGAGRPMYSAKDWIVEVLKLHPADMILLMIGVNDLAWCCTAEDVIGFGGELVENARSVIPDIKIAFANVPLQKFKPEVTPNILRYNEHLPGNISKWSTPESPVGHVDLAGRYGCGNCDCPAGYDGLHPNGFGDFTIAHAFSETLIKFFGLGSCPVEIPNREEALIRFLPAPNKLNVFTYESDVVATWDGVYGAYQYRLEFTVNGGGVQYVDLDYNFWTGKADPPGANYTMRVAALAQGQLGPFSDYTTSYVYGSASAPPAIIPRDIATTRKFVRDDAATALIPRDECVGGIPPPQQSCRAWKRANPSISGGFVRGGGGHSSFGFFVFLAFVSVTGWFGYRALGGSRGHRKYYLRLDEMRRGLGMGLDEK